MADEKQLALTNALAQIERQFGKGSIMKMGEFTDKMAFDVISTGSIALDLALGVGGLPRGRVIEIYGPESSGKTTLALHVIAEAQKAGGTAAFVDVEHALDPTYAQALGIDLDNLLVSQPDAGEQALDIAEMLVRSNAVERNIIGKSGSWYTYGEQRIGQGRENAKAFLEEHTDVADEIATKIREALKATVSPNGIAKPVGAAAQDDG